MNSPHLQRPHLATALTLGLLLCATSCTSNSDDPMGGGPPVLGPTIADLIELDDDLQTLVGFLKLADLLDDLDTPGAITLIAPTDAAFGALGTATLDFLTDPANVADLIDLLEYHIIGSDLDEAAIRMLPTLPGLNGDELLVDPLGPLLYLNNAVVADPDISASNGTYHVVDAVLRPPISLLDTLQQRELTTLADLIQQAGLEGSLTGADVTLFAPTNDAFLALDPAYLAFLQDPVNVAELIDVLTYHVNPLEVKATQYFIAGELPSVQMAFQFFGLRTFIPTINLSPVSALNLPATDGIIQEVDFVVEVPVDVMATLEANEYSILVNALEVAGLADDLRTASPFTVFAPTDQAFNDLPPGVLDDLLLPANQQQLIDLLQYHMLAETRQAREIRTRQALDSIQGALIAVDPTDGILILNGTTQVRRPDTFASNGVVHGIAAVLDIPAP